jgi:hypothetical protein
LDTEPTPNAEALNGAIDALLAGESRRAAGVGLPLDLEPLLDAGAHLRDLGASLAGGPSPGFVLGLEDQLRTDLRLHLRPAAGEPHRTWLAPVLLALGLLLAAVWLAAQGAVPGDALYVLKRGAEAPEVVLAPDPGARSRVYFRHGRRRLEEVGVLLSVRHRAALLDDLLDDLVIAYSRGTTAAMASADPMVVVRARVEVRAAEVELDGMLDDAGGTDREEIGDTREALLRLLEPVDASPTGEPPVAAIEPTTAVPTRRPPPGPTPAPSATVPATAPALSPPQPTATVPPRPTADVPTSTLPPPMPSATRAAPSATAWPTELPTRPPRDDPGTDEPTAAPSATASANHPVVPSPTTDRWPTDFPTEPGPTPPDTSPTAGATPAATDASPSPPGTPPAPGEPPGGAVPRP